MTIQLEVSELDRLREKIDQIDTEIRTLIIQRMQSSQSARRVKLTNGLPDIDIRRENEVLGKYRAVLGTRHGIHIGQAILDFSKD